MEAKIPLFKMKIYHGNKSGRFLVSLNPGQTLVGWPFKGLREITLGPQSLEAL